MMDRVRVENLSQDPTDFVDLGVTLGGVLVQVSRRYLESDLSIAAGNAIPACTPAGRGVPRWCNPG